MRGWSQEILAVKLQCLGGRAYEMTRQTVANIESGRRNLYHWHIEAIRDAFGCSYDEIFLGPKVNGASAGGMFKKPFQRRRPKRKPGF